MVFHWSLCDSKSPQVSRNLQLSIPHVSNRSQQCYSLAGLHSSSYFHVLQSMYQSFGSCTKSNNHSWYHHIIIIIIIISFLMDFFYSSVFLLSMSDIKSPRVSKTLRILVCLNNAVVCTVTILPLIFNSTSLFFKLLGIVSSATAIIGIPVTFMIHSIFSSQASFKHLSIFSFSFIFTLWSNGTA